MSLRGTWFLRLLAVRVTGQTGDGFFQAALATYALFGDDAASAADLAAAAAVVLLPWSVLGPVAGVALDRWSRRQVLLLGNLGRGGVVLLLALAVSSGASDPVVYGIALVALAVNRFLLAALSAALPHTVPAASLTAANAITPTLGTAGFVAGLGVAAALRAGVGGASVGDAGLLVIAAATYLAAAGTATLLGRRLLGPDHDAGPQSRAGRGLLADLHGGLTHLRHRRHPAAALAALGSMRFWFGLVSVSAVLSLRNATDVESQALGDLAVLTLTTGAGFLAAAALAPLLGRRIGREASLRVGLVIAGTAPLVALVAPPGLVRPAWWLTGAVLGLGAQTTKICVDTVVQAGVADEARGRVFALYDMAFNVAFVLAAGVAAAVLPASGRSAVVLVVCSGGLVASAAAHARATRSARRPRSGPSAETSCAP